MNRKPCYLRRTEIVLADGQAYGFRAIPLTRKTMPIVRALVDDATPDGEKLEAMLSAIELSLSFDYTPEEIEQIMDSGLVPIGNKEIMNALVAGLA